MTPEQLHILQHALGANKYGLADKPLVRPSESPYYRNHYCAGGTDAETCKELVALGWMIQHETTDRLPYFNCSVTKAGIKAMLRASPESPKLTRSQQRYRDYLALDDAFGSISFKDFLLIQKTDWYRDLKAGVNMGPAWMRGL
jgi:hypothetical protein